jgi:hypothetical protein
MLFTVNCLGFGVWGLGSPRRPRVSGFDTRRCAVLKRNVLQVIMVGAAAEGCEEAGAAASCPWWVS